MSEPARTASIKLVALAVYAAELCLCSCAETRSRVSSSTLLPSDNVTRQVLRSNAGSQCEKYVGERVYASIYTVEKKWEINAYKVDQSAEAPPICSAITPLKSSGGMVDDTSGKLWVMDSTAIALEAYPHASEGTVTPLQTIAGSNTELCGFSSGVQGIAEDAHGNIWVPCWYDYNGPFGYIVAFTNDATGNVSPVASIGFADKGQAEGIAAPVAVGFDAQGNLYVAEFTNTPEVVVFSPPFSDNSRPVATWTIQGQYSSAQFVASNSFGVYIGGQKEYVFYKRGLKSKGIPERLVFIPQGASDVRVDGQARMFVAQTGPCDSNGTIAVLPPHAKTYDKYRCLGDSDGTGSLAVGP